MVKLIYSAITSLDGYIADEDGNFDWAAPDEEVHAFVNDLERPVGTYLYGRRMYEVMVFWETAHTFADQRPVMQDFAKIWQAADKVVYSTTLAAVSSARTRIERDFDRPGWSTSTSCSSRPLWWEAATSRSPTTSACSSNCWTNAGSAGAWFSSATAPERERTATLTGRHGLGRFHSRLGSHWLMMAMLIVAW